jgi:hypothetical protein
VPRNAMRALLLLVFAASAVCACVGRAPDRPTRGEPPPAPLPEIRSGPPTPGLVWVPGEWHWDGVKYVWLPGHWESPPPVAAGS